MKEMLATMVTLCVLLAGAGSARGQARLSCQADLVATDCARITGAWPANELLRAAVSCMECTGGGSDISCSPAELTTAERLAVEVPSGQQISGSFTAAGSCGFGVPLYRYSQLLPSGGSYWLIGNIPGFDKVLLIEFTTSGAGPTGDGGAALDDGGAPPGDSGSSSSGDGASVVGDGASPAAGDGATASDGGCGCHTTPSAGGTWPWLIVGLLVFCRSVRRRRRQR